MRGEVGQAKPLVKMKITIEIAINEQLSDTDKKELVQELFRNIQGIIPSEIKIQISDNSDKK